MIKAAAYCRYSSDNQRDESIEAQVRIIKEYAQKNEYTIVKIYVDEARSATTDNRPQFLQMIKDSKLGLFDVILVHKLDRFARNRYDSAFYRRELKKSDVQLISVLEPLNDSPESVILESVLEGMAEYYSKNLAREAMKGMKENAYKCKHNGGIPPFGYDVDPVSKTYIINQHEAKAVKLIFEMYADGEGYSSIIKKLNNLGYKTKKGNKFGKNSIHDLLRNEKYTGVYIFNRAPKKINGKYNKRKQNTEQDIIKINGGMPAIIDRTLWKKVQLKMDRNKYSGRKAIVTYLLSGLIFCGKCGGAMVGNTRRFKDRDNYIYCSYNCSAKQRKRTCNMKGIEKQTVEEYVINSLQKKLFNSKTIDVLCDKIYEYAQKQNEDLLEDIKAFEKELSKIDTQINNMVEAIANGMFHPSMKEKMTVLENKKSEIISIIEETKIKNAMTLPTKEQIKSYILKDSNLKNKSPEELKKIFQTYVEKIIVHENNIEIILRVFFDGCGRRIRTLTK